MIRLLPLLQLLILVHTVDGNGVVVNMELVSSMRAPTGQVTDKAKCLITFLGGQFINSLETCEQVTVLWQREDAKVK